MDWNVEALSERGRYGREAGVRSDAAVSLGACAFGLISAHVDGASDPTRIAMNVVSGVGFLGAGVVLRESGRISGLSTAATLWATALVGLAIAYGMYVIGVLAAWIAVGLLALHHVPAWTRWKLRLRYRKEEKSP